MREDKEDKQGSHHSSGSVVELARPLESESGDSNSQVTNSSQGDTPRRDAERIVGALDAIVGHTVEGWAMNAGSPEKPAIVEIFDGENLLGSAVALIFRADLLAAGIGTGHHHFKFLLPEAIFDDTTHFISARPAGSIENLRKSPTRFSQSKSNSLESTPKAKVDQVAVGMLEVVSDEGWVKGWAWCPNIPEKRVEIEVLVDGQVVGETIAALHRRDLLNAGIGDGNYSFALALPHEVITRPRDSLVSVRDKESRRVLAEPRLFRRLEVSNAVEKLEQLENDARLLNSKVALAADRAAADERAAADLFRTVGDFFVQLASATAAGKPPGSLKTLRGAIDDVTVRFPPIEFRISPAPVLSICVEATGSLEDIYNTLNSVGGFSSNIETEVVLFDTGVCDEASLLPLVLRNLRYIHFGDTSSPAFARNQVVEFAKGEIIIFLAGYASPAVDWTEDILACFNTENDLGAVAAKILRNNGALENAGLKLINGSPVVLGLGADPSSEEFSNRKFVDAVAIEAYAVRREIWRNMGGLKDDHFALDALMVELCARIKAAGGKIMYESSFEVVLRS